LTENTKRFLLIFSGFVYRIYRIDIDLTMAGMVLIGGKVDLGYKVFPGDDHSHEEAARPRFRVAIG
jgi:hypothetical protein